MAQIRTWVGKPWAAVMLAALALGVLATTAWASVGELFNSACCVPGCCPLCG